VHFCDPAWAGGAMTMGELLPRSFGPADLGVKR
jgi:hypothetical protein